jgi:UDP:flavonoid glycosyltransferase YjiC (YdhE family)
MFGHFLPVVPLAVTLQDRGHDVLVATGPSFVARAEERGLRGAGVGRDLSVDDMLAVLPEIFDIPPEDQDAYARPRVFVGLRAHNAIDDLLALASDWQPDLVVREVAEFASWAVAEKLSVPHVAVNAGAATTASEWDDFAGPWFLELGRHLGLSALRAEDLYRYGVFSFEPSGYNDWSETPTARIFRPADLAASSAEQAWLDGLDDRPLVYVTLGTEFFQADLMRSIVDALAGGQWSVVVTTGPAGEPSEVDPELPHVVVARWLPQDEVLDRAAVGVCHAGSGTTIGALVRGVPLVCLPQGADQFEHARRVTDLGAGLTLDLERRTPSEIEAAVAAALSQPQYRMAATRVADATAQLPDVHVAAEHLERLV